MSLMSESQCITTRVSWPHVDPHSLQLSYPLLASVAFDRGISQTNLTKVSVDAQMDVFTSEKYAQNFGLILKGM